MDLSKFRLLSYAVFGVVSLSIGVGLDHYFLNKNYMDIKYSANQYRQAVKMLNGFGTNFLPGPMYLRMRGDTNRPIVMGMIGFETCFNCVKSQMLLMKDLLSKGKISMLIMIVGYRDKADQVSVLEEFKDFPWVYTYPMPDSLLRSNLGLGRNEPSLFSPLYVILSANGRKAFFLPLGNDSADFTRLLSAAIEHLKSG